MVGGAIQQNVIPAQAGTQYSAAILVITGSRFRGDDACV